MPETIENKFDVMERPEQKYAETGRSRPEQTASETENRDFREEARGGESQSPRPQKTHTHLLDRHPMRTAPYK